MSSRGIVWSGSVLAVLAIAAVGGAYLKYPDLLSAADRDRGSGDPRAPVSEAVYGTGTVEPERWAKVVPMQTAPAGRTLPLRGAGASKTGQVLAPPGRRRRSATRCINSEINNEQLRSATSIARSARSRQNDAAKTEYEQRSTQFEQSKSRIGAPKVPHRSDSCSARRWMEWCCVATARSARSSGPTDVLFWVGPPAPMQVVAEINEEEITRIAVGQKAFLRSEALLRAGFAGHGFANHAKGRPRAKDLSRLSAAAARYAVADRNDGRSQHHLSRKRPRRSWCPTRPLAATRFRSSAAERFGVSRSRSVSRGSRNVEIIGDVSKGATVLSPARADLG